MERRLELSDSYIGGGSGRPRVPLLQRRQLAAIRGVGGGREASSTMGREHNGSALGAASVAARTRIRVSGPIAAGDPPAGGDTSARALAASFGGGRFGWFISLGRGSCC